MGMSAARMTDMHTSPMVTVLVPHVGGPVLPPCCPTVLIGAMCVGQPEVIILGSFPVMIGGPTARIADIAARGGLIMMGWPTVLIG